MRAFVISVLLVGALLGCARQSVSPSYSEKIYKSLFENSIFTFRDVRA